MQKIASNKKIWSDHIVQITQQNWVNISAHPLTLYHTMQLLTILRKTPFENIVGKGKNAGNQHFLRSTMFSTLSMKIHIISATSKLSSSNAFNLNKTTFLSFGKGLKTGKKSRKHGKRRKCWLPVFSPFGKPFFLQNV